MELEEAKAGKRVRDLPWEADLEGREGTITRRWDGNARFVALDVLLDDGTTRLFWHHELEKLGDEAGVRGGAARGRDS